MLVSSRILKLVAVIVIALTVAACGTARKDGQYYQDDGPPRFKKGPNPDKVPNAVPRNEPLSRTGNNPYTALGKDFVPMKSARGYQKTGYASWYGRKYHGRRTSSGETYDMYAMTAAHPTLPLPSYVRVRHLGNGRQVVVKVNDRGPFLNDRIIDLSYMAAKKLGVVATGTARVEIETVFADGDSGRPAGEAKEQAERPAPLVAENYMLQAGSFASEGNAARLKNRLLQGGYNNVMVTRVVVASRVYHRVQVGPFNGHESARQNAGSLEAYLNSPVSVVRMPG